MWSIDASLLPVFQIYPVHTSESLYKSYKQLDVDWLSEANRNYNIIKAWLITIAFHALVQTENTEIPET